MLIRRLKVSGLLSFGPRGIDLPMEPLNALIGPNGSGKSNLLESPGAATVEVIVYPAYMKGPLRRRIGGGTARVLEQQGSSIGSGIIDCPAAGMHSTFGAAMRRNCGATTVMTPSPKNRSFRRFAIRACTIF